MVFVVLTCCWGGHCVDLLLFALRWLWCSTVACMVEEFSAPCVVAFDCLAMFFQMLNLSI